MAFRCGPRSRVRGSSRSHAGSNRSFEVLTKSVRQQRTSCQPIICEVAHFPGEPEGQSTRSLPSHLAPAPLRPRQVRRAEGSPAPRVTTRRQLHSLASPAASSAAGRTPGGLRAHGVHGYRQSVRRADAGTRPVPGPGRARHQGPPRGRGAMACHWASSPPQATSTTPRCSIGAGRDACPQTGPVVGPRRSSPLGRIRREPSGRGYDAVASERSSLNDPTIRQPKAPGSAGGAATSLERKL